MVGAADRQRIGVLLHQWRDSRPHVLHHGHDVEGLQEEVHLAGFDLGEIEDIVDEC